MKEYHTILSKVELFEGIEEADYEAILSCLSAKAVRYEKNQTVLLKGDNAIQVGIVLSGQVQVIKEDYYGNRSIMAKLDQGSLFGETFVCADIKKLPVSVFTTAESNILFINYHRLIYTCTNTCAFHSKLIYNMLRIVARKNIMLNQKIEFMTKRSTREKLLAYLAAEAQKAGSGSFTIPYNREELADYLSVDRSAMSAELGRMRDDGLIRFQKNNFTLL